MTLMQLQPPVHTTAMFFFIIDGSKFKNATVGSFSSIIFLLNFMKMN